MHCKAIGQHKKTAELVSVPGVCGYVCASSCDAAEILPLLHCVISSLFSFPTQDPVSQKHLQAKMII